MQIRSAVVNNKISMRSIGLFVACLIAILSICVISSRARSDSLQGGTSKARTESQKPNSIFNEIIPTLISKTQVPVLLPSEVPYADDKSAPLYAILHNADAKGYSIELAWSRDCEGGNACHVGYIGAASSPLSLGSGGSAKRVVLIEGIAGRFTDFSCGAHCDDATVSWDQKGYHYAISLNAGKKNMLVKMANSAISVGRIH